MNAYIPDFSRKLRAGRESLGQAVRIVFHGQPVELATPPGNKLQIFLSRSSIWVEELEVSPAASDL